MIRISLYLAKTVIVNSLLVLLVLTVLASLITFVGEIHNLSSTYTVAEAARFTLFKIPGGMYDMFTISTLLGALLGLGELAGNNELTVMRVAGVSVARLGMAAMVGGVVLALMCVLLGELIVPTTERMAEDRRAELVNARTNVLGTGGIWAKDGPSFVNVRAMTNRNMARGIYIYQITPNRQLSQITFANSAVFDTQPPQLHALRATRFLGADGASVYHMQTERWSTSLNPSIISLFSLAATSLSAASLHEYIGYLRANHLDEGRYVAEFWDHIARPVALLLMLMLSLPFVFGPLRSSSTGQRMLVGMLVGIGFYVFNTMFMQTGVVFGLDPFATAWLPTLLLGGISILAVRRIR
ncbi:MAG TPA: LPS export ABC transporter permease LptG [Gammaproteobacteria bacterium]|nr:LPS export ABC transporter permease LptG [Gammaproteobacteria bacterium]